MFDCLSPNEESSIHGIDHYQMHMGILLNLHIEDINCNNIVCLAIVLKLSISSFLDTDVEKANKRKRFEPGTFKPIKANMAYIIIKINVFIGWITPKKVKILV